MAHIHSIYDSDLHFIIDPITRKITSECGKVTLMQTDHNSERFTFEIPRYIEGHDMSLTDKVEIHYINLEHLAPKRSASALCPVLDLQVSPDSDDKVIFSWLISGAATQYAGTLSFMVRFVCYAEDDSTEIAYQLWSDAFKQISILSTTNNSGIIVDVDTNDVLEAWKLECLQAVYDSEVFSDLETLRDGYVNQIHAAGSGYVNQITTAGNDCINRIEEVGNTSAEYVAGLGPNYVEQAKSYAEQAKTISGLSTVQPLIDAIQTTSRGTLGTSGWYRVAEYASTTASVKGAQGNSCTLRIKRSTTTKNADYYKIALDSKQGEQSFIVEKAYTGAHLFTKVRHVISGTSAYLEVYYNANTNNNCTFIVSDGEDYYFKWKAITPTLTEETVDGVTVTATCDILANTSLLNNVVLANNAFAIGGVGTQRFIAYPQGSIFDSTSYETGQLRITLPQSWGNTRIVFKVGISTNTNGKYTEYIVSGYMGLTSGWAMHDAVCNSTESAYPVHFAHDGEKCVVCIGELTTNWNRVKVYIHDVMIGHYAWDYDKWVKGWNIAITTDNSDLTISATVENPYMFTDYAKNTAVSNIQTTSKATLSTAGWYRVAEINTHRWWFAPLDIRIAKNNNNGESVEYNLRLTTKEFENLSCISGSSRGIEKLRVCTDGTKSYLELYYSLSKDNMVGITLHNAYSPLANCGWKAIDFVATAETTDGITVKVSYDIPANASPFTTNGGDINGDITAKSTSATARRVAVENLNRRITLELIKNGTGYLWDGTNGKAIAQFPLNGEGNVWNGTASGNLALTGGTASGDIEVKRANTDSARVKATSKGGVSIGITANDTTSGMYDFGNGKWVLENCNTSTPKLNGVATGNLPLNGGGTVTVGEKAVEVQGAHNEPFRLNNTVSTAKSINTGYYLNGVLTGRIGFRGASPIVTVDGSEHNILHAGNYGDYNNFYKGLSVTNASGEEGGEIRFAQPETDHSFDSMLTMDIWRDMMRIFATHNGATKLFNIDFTTMKEGGNEALHTGNSAKVSIGADTPSDTANTLWVIPKS